MKIIQKYILIYSTVLTIGFVILLFIYPYLPIYLPYTPIKLAGLLIWIMLTAIIILALKRIKKIKKDVHLLKFTLIGSLIIIISELIYQIIRQFTLENYTISERLELIIKGVAIMAVIGLITSFLTSYQLKTGKTERLILMIIGIMVLFYLLTKYAFPTLIEN